MGLTRSMSARAGGCAALAAIYLGLAATPSAANISGSFGVDPDTNAITLDAISDDEGDTIALGCANERVTINGQTIILGNGFSVACGGSNGPEVIQIFGGGGGDRVVNTGLSRAAGFTNVLRSEGFGGDEIVVEADAGQDTVIGGPFSERINVLFAFEFSVGADRILGNGGSDEIGGTEGKDVLFGGPGNDVMKPGPGADVAHGGPGKDSFDEITFHNQRDQFFGEAGRDQMFGGGGGDLLDGGKGGDYMDGQTGKDTLLGRDGDDGLFGGALADRIFGAGGDDYIRGGPGNDKISPGPGKNDVKQ